MLRKYIVSIATPSITCSGYVVFLFTRARIFKLLRSPGIDSANLCVLAESLAPLKFKNSGSGFYTVLLSESVFIETTNRFRKPMQPGGIDSLESIPELLKSLNI
jgi:hypothetical protein